MKGVIFTAFTEMMEAEFGLEFTDQVLTETELESGGAYTAVGNYPHAELVALVGTISKLKNIPVPELLNAFGKFMFRYFYENYGSFFEGKQTAFEVLAEVDSVIHVAVRALYPDARPPAFTHRQPEPGAFEFTYSSPRKMADFARGLIDEIISHFDEDIEVRQTQLDENGAKVQFLLIKKG